MYPITKHVTPATTGLAHYPKESLPEQDFSLFFHRSSGHDHDHKNLEEFKIEKIPQLDKNQCQDKITDLKWDAQQAFSDLEWLSLKPVNPNNNRLARDLLVRAAPSLETQHYDKMENLKGALGIVQHDEEGINEENHAFPSVGDPIINAIHQYVSTRDTSSLKPMILNPPTWKEAYMSLKKHIDSKRTLYADHYAIRLFELISQEKMFLTQFPVKETIDGVCQIIQHFRDQLQEKKPESPLVIAGIASGNAIYERAILEYFKNKNQETFEYNDDCFIEISHNLLIHCSDKTTYEVTPYRSKPMMPVTTNLDFKDAVEKIAKARPQAYILPFASWIPRGENHWFDTLAQNRSVIGFIHLKEPYSCGSDAVLAGSGNTGEIQKHPLPGTFNPAEGTEKTANIEPSTNNGHSACGICQCSSQYLAKIKLLTKTSNNPLSFEPDAVFLTECFNLLGWGANDALILKEEDSREFALSTVLEVKYPAPVFSPPKLADHLLYSDKLRL